MSSSGNTQALDLARTPELAYGAWRESLLEALRSGDRIVTLYARPADDRTVLTAVLETRDRSLSISRTALEARHGHHEMTSEHPPLAIFEREMHEAAGLRIGGHPWLKPVRFAGAKPTAMDDYPFWSLEGKEVHEVAVGPIHAGVIEPGAFRFQCLGEQVHHLEIHLGYQHRGVERLLLERDPLTLTPLVETIAGDTSIAHAWAHCAALERLGLCELDREIEIARAFALELERVAMHLAGLSGLAADIGFLQGATTYGRLRTTAINTTMKLCGSRFGRGALRPGGIRMRLTPELVREVRANLALLREDLEIVDECFVTARSVQHRLCGVGIVAADRAREIGLVGLAARASGVAVDARTDRVQGAYAIAPIASDLMQDGDCWARARIRIAEIGSSLAWLSAALERFPDWDRPRRTVDALAPETLVVAVVEGWRGEVVHCIETDARGRIAHYKVQDPSLRNWMGLAYAVRKNEISDFPICNKSFDLSYCGNDL